MSATVRTFRCAAPLALGAVLLASTSGAAGWAVGNTGNVLKSTDGISWTLSTPTSTTLNGLYFADDNTGWVVGGAGTILKTTNGGASWSSLNPTTATLNAVTFFGGATNGWIVGTNGTILRTTNGGTSWTSQNPSTATLNAVFFISATTGWAVGTGGAIFKTTNSGTSWSGTFPTTATLNDVFFTSSTVGYAVGTSGSIFKTTNGGTSWTLSNPVSVTLNSVHFTDANTGYIVGGAGTILKTTNAGSSWTAMNPVSAELRAVHFLDANRGWAVGLSSTIARTTNAGGAWTATFPSGAQLNAVQFVSLPANVSVTVQTSPTGRSFTVDGTTYTTAQTFSWLSGSSHTIATSSPQSGATGTQYVFSSWSDAGAMSHSVAPTANATYTASFTTQHMLTMSAGAGGSVSPSSGFRNAGSVVSISATPSAGFGFGGWTGSGSGSYSGANNPASVTMNGPITETAAFVAPISVTVNASPAGRSFSVDGTTYTSQQTFQWTPGSSHTIATTSPQPGGTGTRHVWSAWSDGGAISHTVAPTSAATYTASFATEHFLTMTAGPNGTVQPASGWFAAGAVVPIEATADAGYAFDGWAGTGVGSYTGPDNPAGVTMSGPIEQVAGFSNGQVGVDDPPPTALAFAAPRPNPFRGAIRLTFDLPHDGPASLAIVDVSGRRVAELAGGRLPAGRHARIWKARDPRGTQVPAGIYFAVLEAGGRRITRRIVALP